MISNHIVASTELPTPIFGSAPDAAQAAVIQTQWALGCWTRATERALTLNADWARMQTYVLAPVHSTVSANARRLKTKEKR